MVKIKLSVLIPLAVILIIAVVSYFFFVPRNSYRNDCDKPFSGYDMLFVYTEACPHCKADLERINDLNLSESVYMIDAGSLACQKTITQYSDYIINHKNSNTPYAPAGIATPTKVCLRDNKTYVGEMSLNQLKEFYENCTMVKTND